MMTRRAPRSRWPPAAARETKRPVASSTTSTSGQGISAGRGAFVQRIVRPSATRAPSLARTSASRRPATESCRRRCARIGGPARSLSATTSRSRRPSDSRRNPRPMRPSPLMPMRIATGLRSGKAGRGRRPAGNANYIAGHAKTRRPPPRTTGPPQGRAARVRLAARASPRFATRRPPRGLRRPRAPAAARSCTSATIVSDSLATNVLQSFFLHPAGTRSACRVNPRTLSTPRFGGQPAAARRRPRQSRRCTTGRSAASAAV